MEGEYSIYQDASDLALSWISCSRNPPHSKLAAKKTRNHIKVQDG
jgi:hypothetical protein